MATVIAFIVGSVVGFIVGYFLNAKGVTVAKSDPVPPTGGGPGEGTGGGTH